MSSITKEDIVDAINDENEELVGLVSEYWRQLNKESGATAENFIINAKECAQILYDAKRYQDVLDWLDATIIEIGQTDGDESNAYSMFVQDEDLENIRANALDRNGIELEEDDDDDVEDE